MTTVNGKVVLITGAARGIGAATARELAARGARLALVGLEPATLKELASELGGGAVWAEADVTSFESLQGAVDTVLSETGRIDIVLANAGIASIGTINTTDPSSFAKVVDVNLTGVWNTAKAALGALKASRGYLMVISSIAAFTPIPGLGAYAASKSGVEALAFSLRAELAPDGIAVGVVHPSWIDTDLVRDAEADLPSFKESRAKLPWPTNDTTTVEECVAAIVRGMERRQRRVFIPRKVIVMPLMRILLTSPLIDRPVKAIAKKLVPQMDAEVTALGRSLSAKTVEISQRSA